MILAIFLALVATRAHVRVVAWKASRTNPLRTVNEQVVPSPVKEAPKPVDKPHTVLAVPNVAPLTRHVAHPTGFLQFDKPVVTIDYNTITEGKQFGINMRSRNNSQERVLHAFAITYVYIEPADDQSDRIVLDKFSKEVAGLRKLYSAGKIKGPEVAAGTTGIWGTALTHALSKTETEGIITKRSRLYYASWLVWADLQGRMDWSDDCRWLQLPEGPRVDTGSLVWHFCQE
jgi:hypothetical protein